MCPVMDSSELTLQMMWSTGLQLVVFYHDEAACRRHFQLWPGTWIPAPWHNTVACPALVSAVDGDLAIRLHTPTETFHVTQGILTPDGGFVFSHMSQKLCGTLTGQALNPFLDWLRRQKCGLGGINIVTVDFIELTQIVPIVLDINRTMARCLTSNHDSAALTNSYA